MRSLLLSFAANLFITWTQQHLYVGQLWKHDQNIKTKTKKTKTRIVRPRPRPIKQQQDYITGKKLFCCNTHVCYQKITLCKKTSKSAMMTSYVSQFLHLLNSSKKCRRLLHFSIIMSVSAVTGWAHCWVSTEVPKSHSALSGITVLEARPKA